MHALLNSSTRVQHMFGGMRDEAFLPGGMRDEIKFCSGMRDD